MSLRVGFHPSPTSTHFVERQPDPIEEADVPAHRESGNKARAKRGPSIARGGNYIE